MKEALSGAQWAMTEEELLWGTMSMAVPLGWEVFHTWDSRSTLREAKVALARGINWSGFPDLCLLRVPRLVVMELKSQKGRIDPRQQMWIDGLVSCGIEAGIYRPTQWFDGTIERLLE